MGGGGKNQEPVVPVLRLIRIVHELKLSLVAFRQGISLREVGKESIRDILFCGNRIINWCRTLAVHAHVELILFRVGIAILAHRHSQDDRSVGDRLAEISIIDILVARLPSHGSPQIPRRRGQQHIFIDGSTIHERHLIMVKRVFDGSLGIHFRRPDLLRRTCARREGSNIERAHVGVIDRLMKQHAFISYAGQGKGDIVGARRAFPGACQRSRNCAISIQRDVLRLLKFCRRGLV